MLMRLNLLCSLLEMTILPPPGGPMAARRNMSYKVIIHMLINGLVYYDVRMYSIVLLLLLLLLLHSV